MARIANGSVHEARTPARPAIRMLLGASIMDRASTPRLQWVTVYRASKEVPDTGGDV